MVRLLRKEYGGLIEKNIKNGPPIKKGIVVIYNRTKKKKVSVHSFWLKQPPR